MESNPLEHRESHAEKIHTKEEVLAVITPHIEGPHTIARELRDEKGLYLLEVNVEGAASGEIVEYGYMRKGRHGNNNEASEDRIDITYYQNGIPISGESFAHFNTESRAWEKIT